MHGVINSLKFRFRIWSLVCLRVILWSRGTLIMYGAVFRNFPRQLIIQHFLNYTWNITNSLLWKLWSIYCVLHNTFLISLLFCLFHILVNKADLFPWLFAFLFYAFITPKLYFFLLLLSFRFCLPALGGSLRYQVSISSGGRLQAAVE